MRIAAAGSCLTQSGKSGKCRLIPTPTGPQALQEALTDYRKVWRAKMDEVNACIAAASEGEELVDQPEIDRQRVRVSGPFTVEAVQPAEESLGTGVTHRRRTRRYTRDI